MLLGAVASARRLLNARAETEDERRPSRHIEDEAVYNMFDLLRSEYQMV